MNLSLKPECLQSTKFGPDFSEMELEKKKRTYKASALSDLLQTKRREPNLLAK